MIIHGKKPKIGHPSPPNASKTFAHSCPIGQRHVPPTRFALRAHPTISLTLMVPPFTWTRASTPLGGTKTFAPSCPIGLRHCAFDPVRTTCSSHHFANAHGPPVHVDTGVHASRRHNAFDLLLSFKNVAGLGYYCRRS